MESSSARSKFPEIGLQRILRLVWRRKWFIIIPVVLITVLVVALTITLSTPMYESTTELLQKRSGLDRILLGTDVFLQNYQPERTLETSAALVKSPEVIDAVSEELGSELDGDNPVVFIEVTTMKKSDILRISATHEDPELAAMIANSFAENFIQWRREENLKTVEEAIESLEEQVASFTPEQQTSSEYQQLFENLQSLRVLSSIDVGNLEIIRPASVSSSPVSPKPAQNGIIAFTGSFILMTGVVLLVDRLDTKVRTTDELSEIISQPVMAVIPKQETDDDDIITISNPRSPCAEAFRLLKTNLRYIAPGREMKSLIVTSAEPCEGKSTVITNLAVTMARAGDKVILFEGDLRRPMLSSYLHLDDLVGMSNAIIGNCTLRESLQLIDKEDLTRKVFFEGSIRPEVDYEGFRDIKPIYVATAGPVPPNPSELITSPAMASLIREAEDHCDYLLIDTPPLGVVSDAAGLSAHVDGILIVVRLSRTTKQSLDKINKFIESIPDKVFGIVVVDADRGGGGGYYYTDTEYYR